MGDLISPRKKFCPLGDPSKKKQIFGSRFFCSSECWTIIMASSKPSRKWLIVCDPRHAIEYSLIHSYAGALPHLIKLSDSQTLSHFSANTKKEEFGGAILVYENSKVRQSICQDPRFEHIDRVVSISRLDSRQFGDSDIVKMGTLKGTCENIREWSEMRPERHFFDLGVKFGVHKPPLTVLDIIAKIVHSNEEIDHLDFD